jgi:hypothetical protein
MPDRQFRPHRAETPLLDLLENLAVMQTDTELEVYQSRASLVVTDTKADAAFGFAQSAPTAQSCAIPAAAA